MPKQLSEKIFVALIEYYISCLEQEDRLAITFDLTSEGTRFTTAVEGREELFHEKKHDIVLQKNGELNRFFKNTLLQQKNKSFFYGYPILIDQYGMVSPLFFTELQYEQTDETLRCTSISQEPTVNHYILQQEGFQSEEITHLLHELKDDEDFISSLTSICKTLNLDATLLSQNLVKKPLTSASKIKIVNKAILYFGERTDITHNLITELQQLKKKPLDDIAASSLYILLTSEYPPEKQSPINKPLLEVFPLNISQESAVQNALTKPLTVITGPPGTGKSQVVLNIIANAVYQNKTVLFASKNNKAVDVVIEKLHAILQEKLIVRMGHRTHRRNTKAILNKLFSKDNKRISIPSSEATINDLLRATKDITQIQDQITAMSLLNQSIDRAQQTIDSLMENLPLEFFEQWNHLPLGMIDYLSLQHEYESLFTHVGVFPRISDIINPRRKKSNQESFFKTFIQTLPSELQTYLINKISQRCATPEQVVQWILWLKQIELLENEQQTLKQKLFGFPSFIELKSRRYKLHEKRTSICRPLFETYWMNKLAQISDDERQSVIDYFTSSEHLESWVGDQTIFRQLHSERLRTFQKVLRFLPVWVVTNLSAKQSFPLKNDLFDLLIIDEASQCDIASALPLFYRAKHVVIIGDPHQLRHISVLNETQDKAIAIQHGLPALFTDFSYSKHSLYDLAEYFVEKNKEHPILLNEHYRSHPDIISYSNEYYYGKKLMVETDQNRLLHYPFLQTHVMWHDIKGKTVHTKSPYNEEEAEKVAEETLKLLGLIREEHMSIPSIGIVTLFRAHTEVITEKLSVFQEVLETDITVGTAHKFQGDEKDIIVFSPGVSEGVKPGTLQWIQTTNQLLNVAVSRARSLLIIVGDQHVCSESPGPLKDLVDYVATKTMEPGIADSQEKQMLFNELKRQGIEYIRSYVIRGNPPDYLDCAIVVNGQRYAIEIIPAIRLTQLNERKKRNEQIQLEGWHMRRFSEKNIQQDLSSIINEIQRLC